MFNSGGKWRGCAEKVHVLTQGGLAAETVQGLARLGIVHETMLPYSPYQNGKQESFWGQVEGRLLPMLEDVPDLTLRQLNEATLAWLEMEYNRKPHSELGQSPVQAYLHLPDVGRPCPTSQELQRAFTAEVRRTVRRSDGTISLGGVRFEIPSRYSSTPSPPKSLRPLSSPSSWPATPNS